LNKIHNVIDIYNGAIQRRKPLPIVNFRKISAKFQFYYLWNIFQKMLGCYEMLNFPTVWLQNLK